MKLPKGWKRETIGDLCTFTNGHGFGPTDWRESGMPIIRIQNLNGAADFNYFDGTPDPSWLVEPGTLLFAWAGTRGVSFGPKIWNGPLGVLNQHIYRVRPAEKVDQRWLYLAFRRVTDRIERMAHGFKSTLLHVGKSDITGQGIDVPPLPEQRKIADILSTWDEALETLDALIAAKERRKQAVMQRVLTWSVANSKKRHARHRLGEICERVTRRNAVSSDDVLTISAQAGLVNQRDYFNRSVAGADLSKYYLLKQGEFAYNRSTAKGYPYGAIKRLDRYETGVVSTLYLCFRLKSNVQVSSNYLVHYFEGGYLNSGLRAVAKEGARAHGLLNVTAEDFFDLDVFLPPLAEQEHIANVLETCDSELALLRRQRDSLDLQKRGLMQRLLTGMVRVTPTPKADV